MSQAFGQFLLSKHKAPGFLGELAQAGARDPRFPRDGSPKDVCQHLNKHGAPPEFHDALDEAAAEWRATH